MPTDDTIFLGIKNDKEVIKLINNKEDFKTIIELNNSIKKININAELLKLEALEDFLVNKIIDESLKIFNK